MQNKLQEELKKLAVELLQLNSNEEIEVLLTKTHELYQKLTVLAYLNNNEKSSTNIDQQVGFDMMQINKNMEVVEKEFVKQEKVSTVLNSETELKKEQALKQTLQAEFEHVISLEETSNLFENSKRVTNTKSINEAIMQHKNLQIDLNDRIAFVKNLFENSQEDFNRVISQLNSMETEGEALGFLKLIKKDYNWSGKEVYEERLLVLIERKFN